MQESTNLSCAQEAAEGAYASYSPRTGDFPHQDIPQRFPTPFEVGEPFSYFHQVQDSPMTDGVHPGDWESPQEPNYDPGLYNGGEQWHQDFEEPCQPHHAIVEPQARFFCTLETPTLSHRSDEGGHDDRSPSLSPVIEGNQTMAPVAAESLAVNTNRNRARFRNRKKKPYERRPEGEKKRKREKKPRDPATQEYIPVGHLRSWYRSAVNVDRLILGSPFHIVVHTPRSPGCATNQVPM